MPEQAPQRAIVLPRSLSVAQTMTQERARMVLAQLQKKQELVARDARTRELRAALQEAIGVLNKPAAPSAAMKIGSRRIGQ